MLSREQTIVRIAPFSAFRTALAVSLVCLGMWLVCAAGLYFGLSAFGVWDQVNQLFSGIGSEQTVTFTLVISLASLVGCCLAIIATLMAPLLAVVYNAIVDLFGGIRVRVQD